MLLPSTLLSSPSIKYSSSSHKVERDHQSLAQKIIFSNLAFLNSIPLSFLQPISLSFAFLFPQFFFFLSSTLFLSGSAFPTSISVNHIICNFSPLPSEASSSQALKKGDVVKIQLGAQLDGYAAIVAETLVVGATKESPVEGKTADLLKAVQVASEVAIRVMKPGATNLEVARKIEEAVKEFG